MATPEEVFAACPNAKTRLAYGTAGFRARADLLDAVFLRMGALAALRSVQFHKVRPSLPRDSQ